MANGGKPISQWLKKNLNGKYSTDSTITNSPSDATQGSRSTVIDGLLSIDTSSMFDDNEQPQSLVMANVDASYNSFSPNQAVYDKYNSSKSFDNAGSAIKEDYDKPWPTFKKMRERQFGSKSSLKRLSRYKMRPSLFSAYANPDLNRGRDKMVQSPGKGTSVSRGKHIRIGLFYTWSFSGQRQRKIVTVGENELGQNPKLDKLWEEAAKALKNTEEDKSADLKESYSTNRVYETAEELKDEKKRMNPQWTSTIRVQDSRTVQPTVYGRYSDASNRSLYRNIYPYTTMRHSNAPSNRRTYPVGPQYDFRTLPMSKRKVNRNNPNSADIQQQNDTEKNMESVHKSFYGMMTGNKPVQRDYNGYYTNPMVPVNPMLMAPIPPQTQPMRIPVFGSSAPETVPDNRRSCSSRNCIFGWALGMTAILILSLAIALFIQSKRFFQKKIYTYAVKLLYNVFVVNRDNNEFKNLQEKIASAANVESAYTSTFSNGGLASEIGLFHKTRK